jgi:hypothetical protein
MGERRKKGTAKTPRIEVKISFLRERFTVLISSKEDFTGNPIALEGQMAAQLKQ